MNVLAALHYVDHGWPVLPLRERGKRPCTPRGVYDATLDPRRVAAFWRRWPNANVGMAVPEEVLVVDWDPPNAGGKTFDQFASEIRLGTTGGPIQRTGEGRHLLFRYPPGVLGKDLRSSVPGLDLKRGPGGYIVVAPSIHKNGSIYTWISGTEMLAAGPSSLPEVPSELLQLLRRPWPALPGPSRPTSPAPPPPPALGQGLRRRGSHRSAIDRARAYAARSPLAQGLYGATYRTCAALVRDFGLSTEEVFDILWPMAERCFPPMAANDLRRTIANALRYGRGAVYADAPKDRR